MSSKYLSHVAMSVPVGTLTDAWRAEVLDFYGRCFGWHELDELRLPDRLTIGVGSSYINVRERADAPAYNGYEHFGVVVASAEAARAIWAEAAETDVGAELEPLTEGADGFVSFRVRYLLPLTVEVQYFPPRA
jgi:hypothetical protein